MVLIAWIVCRRRAWLDLHELESSFVCSSESVLWVVGPDVALLLWCGRLGNVDAVGTSFAIFIRTLLLVWALNSLATYWIIPSVSQHLYVVKA